MIFSRLSTTATLLSLLVVPSHAHSVPRQSTNLTHWPAGAAEALDIMIAANADQGNYACFDMDQTSYRYDLTESLLPFLENRGVLTRDNLDPSLKLIPFEDTANYTETLFSYYYRLCDIDDKVCYPWIAQAFSGLSLSTLKTHVDALMESAQPINTTYLDDGVVTPISVNPPVVYPGQVELYNELTRNNITVYVITAASEEIVRMVASDPKYGYNVAPENVIGVATLLRNASSGALTSSRLQIEHGAYDEQANRALVYTSTLWSPLTWYSGKWAAILEYIDQWKKPVLVAGDTPTSDGYMLFHGVDVAKGGIHLWVNRREAYFEVLQDMIVENTAAQVEYGLPVTADKNWVVVTPPDIL